MNAADLGRRAGRMLLSPSLNPFPDGSADALEWEREWRQACGKVIAERDAARRRRRVVAGQPCAYRPGEECNCGGRALCVVAA